MILKNKIIGCEMVKSMNLSNTFQILQKTKFLDLNGRVIDINNYHSMTATYMSGVILSILSNIRSLVPLTGQL